MLAHTAGRGIPGIAMLKETRGQSHGTCGRVTRISCQNMIRFVQIVLDDLEMPCSNVQHTCKMKSGVLIHVANEWHSSSYSYWFRDPSPGIFQSAIPPSYEQLPFGGTQKEIKLLIQKTASPGHAIVRWVML